MNLEVENIKKLIKVLLDNDLSELSIEDKDENSDNKQGITLKRNLSSGTNVSFIPGVQQHVADNKESEKEESECETPNNDFGKPVLSPVTGTFYVSSTPGGDPFVKQGEIVSVGQVLCIVEAMKLMNEIEAEVSGKITKICAQDGEMVENGQILMYIE